MKGIYFFLWILVLYVQNSDAQSHIVYDLTNNVVLDRHQDLTQHPPASLAKMMTAYLTFEALKNKALSLEDRLNVPKAAIRVERRHIGLKENELHTVRDLLNATIVYSANDAAVTLAEHLDQNEAAFAERMTQTARRLGMSRTIFKNASGLPHPYQTTCARDMMILSRALITDFPEYYPLFGQNAFVFQERAYATSNTLLGRYDEVDGIKTGYISSAKHNFAVSAVKGKNRYIVVVLGEHSKKERDEKVCSLLDLPDKKPAQRVLIINKTCKRNKKGAQVPTPKKWVVQAGTFKNRPLAMRHLQQVRQKLKGVKGAQMMRVAREKKKHKVYIGRFDHPSLATHVCRQLQEKQVGCLVTNA